MQLASLFSQSPEWNYCYFRLQLILSHPNIQITSINKNVNKNSFMVQKQNYFKIDAAIDVSQIEQTDINNLKNNKKKANIFKCGRINQECQYLDGMGNTRKYKLLLFKIAVKQSLSIYKTNSLTKQDLYNCSQQYDSIYISTKREEMMVYDHEYFVKSSNQYVWEYEIQYNYINADDRLAKVRKWNPQIHKCEQCQTNKAYWYCLQQKQIFCKECFEQTHKGRNRNTHKKQMINPFNCHKKCQKPAHNANLLQFYCYQCKQLKCIKCLNDINHSSTQINSKSQNILFANNSLSAQNNLLGIKGSAQKSSRQDIKLNRQSGQSFKVRKTAHQIVQIRQLVSQYNQKQQSLIGQLKWKLGQKVKQLQQMIQMTNKKYQQKLSELQQNLALSISILKKQSLKKINKLISIHIQLKRKFDEVLWMQKFVQYNQQVLDGQSNLKLKQHYLDFVALMNAQQYFKKIQFKISQIKAKTT